MNNLPFKILTKKKGFACEKKNRKEIHSEVKVKEQHLCCSSRSTKDRL